MLTVYSRRSCERCSRVKKQLASAGVEYEELIIGEDVDREIVLSMFPDQRQLPIVTEDGKIITPPQLLNEG